jgi:pyrroloquinoline quinone (PQQ) biosynthesis protein C
MELESVRALVAEAVEGLALLDHPFYRRWAEGQLTADDLAAYAGQYRHFERLLPGLLGRIGDRAEGRAAELVARNLADEAGSRPTHVELFEQFARAVGADEDVPAGPAAQGLVDTYDAVTDDPAAALAALAAYEYQAADIARTKAAGLRSFYGLDGSAVAFWDVHAALEADHAEWAVEAISYLPADPDRVRDAARRAAKAWWSFLDEREGVLAG